MIHFHCFFQWDRDERDDWDGVIKQIIYFGSHYEILISSRSISIRLLVGKGTSGLFACLPEYQAGCNLSALDDTFYNSDRLIYAMEDPVDGTTVACALKALDTILDFPNP
jgi:hypothetical protein